MRFNEDIHEVDILISPFADDWDFLSYLRGNSKKSIKLLTKESFFKRFYIGNSTLAVRFLVEKYHYSYEKAKTLLKFCFHPLLTSISDENVQTLLCVKKALLSAQIYQENPYMTVEFSTKKVAIFGYDSQDVELIQVLHNLGVSHIIFFPFEEQKLKIPVIESLSLDAEVNFVFQHIMHHIKQGISPRDIRLVVADNDYDYALRYYSYYFGLPCALPSSSTLYTLPVAKQFIENPCLETVAFFKQDVRHQGAEIYLLFQKILETYPIGNMSKETYQELLIALLKETSLPSPQYENGITILSHFPFDISKPIFMIGFNEKTYPHIHKDDDYLEDSAKKALGMLTSRQTNDIETAMIKQMVGQYQNGLLTYKLFSNNGEYYPSPILQGMHLKPVKQPWVSTQFSQNIAEIDYAKHLDIKRKYKLHDGIIDIYAKVLDIPYLTYNSTFTGVKAIEDHSNLHLSYSKISDYYKCPFLYYIRHVLKLDVFEANFLTKFGTLAHNVFMERYHDDYSFDRAFAFHKDDIGFDDKEAVWLLRLQEEVRQVDTWISDHERRMNKVAVFCEKEVTITMDQHTFMSGRIDKMYVTTDGKKEYLFVIDYKTSKESYHDAYVDYGFSLQLPIYAYFIKQDPHLNQYALSGLYIQPILLSQTSAKEESVAQESYAKAFRYQGLTIDEPTIILSFDDCAKEESVIAGSLFNKDGSFSSRAPIRNQEFFDQLNKRAETMIKQAIAHIRDNDFAISPKTMTSTPPCQNCDFRHLCFRKETDIVRYATLEKEEEDDE